MVVAAWVHGCCMVAVHGCQGACMVAERHAWLPGGHAWLLVEHGKGGGHAWQRGACVVKGGVHGEGGHAWQGGGMHGIRQDTEIRSMSGWYASYWNAFLFIQDV